MAEKEEKKGEEEWSGYSCSNKECMDYGVSGKGNIRLERYYGRNRVALLRCKTCMKTFCFSKDGEYLASYIDILQAWFNFTKKHRSLKIRNEDGSYTHRTPAMAQGPADRPLKLEDILRWRCN